MLCLIKNIRIMYVIMWLLIFLHEFLNSGEDRKSNAFCTDTKSPKPPMPSHEHQHRTLAAENRAPNLTCTASPP